MLRAGGPKLRDRFLTFVDCHEVAWELGMAVLAVVYVGVGFLADDPGAPAAYTTLDAALTVIFIAEFGSRFTAASDRRLYLRGHIVDLVALMPAVRGLRIARLLRLLRLVRAFAGVFRFVSGLE